jgi:hypothetical protein
MQNTIIFLGFSCFYLFLVVFYAFLVLNYLGFWYEDVDTEKSDRFDRRALWTGLVTLFLYIGVNLFAAANNALSSAGWAGVPYGIWIAIAGCIVLLYWTFARLGGRWPNWWVLISGWGVILFAVILR